MNEQAKLIFAIIVLVVLIAMLPTVYCAEANRRKRERLMESQAQMEFLNVPGNTNDEFNLDLPDSQYIYTTPLPPPPPYSDDEDENKESTSLLYHT